MSGSFIVEIPGWGQLRKKVLGRDGWLCRICGADIDGRLNVHHIDYDRRHNYGRNLVTLCSCCHKAVHNEGYQPCLYEDWPAPWGEQNEDDSPL